MTQTDPQGDPDPMWSPDSDSGPEPTQTQTARDAQTQTGAQTQTDNGLGLGSPNGLSAAQTQTQTTQTQTPSPVAKITADGLSLGAAQTPTTQTQTKAQRLTAAFTRVGYLYVLTAIVSVIAALGQKIFAEKTAGFVNQIKIFGFDLTPWFAPAVYDLAVAALLHGGLNAARDRNSPWPWWLAGAGVAGWSVYTNTQHDGWQVTATASAGLFLIWGLHLFNEYKKIIRKRELDDAVASDFRPDDVLFSFDVALAQSASRIARSKSMVAALAFRHEVHGETSLTRRDVAIRAAEIERDVLADQLYLLTHPADAAPAGSNQDGTSASRPSKKVRWWNRGARKRALRLARMSAADAVDRYLGRPVLERTGLIPGRMSWAEPEVPVIVASTLGQPAPAQRRPARAIAVPDDDPGDDDDVVVVTSAPARRRSPAPGPVSGTVLLPGQPGGPAGLNWLPIEQIPGLPDIDPGLVCECSSTKPCGKTLLEHTQRRGKQVLPIVTRLNQWDTRVERVGKGVVKEYCQIGGSSQQNEIAGLFDHLRKLAQQQLAARGATALAEIEAPLKDGEPEA